MLARLVVIAIAALGLLAAVVFLGIATGQNVNAGIILTIDLTPPDAENEVGTQHTVTATVDDGGPVPDADVAFDVISGPNTGDGGLDTTDSNGEATFTYTGDGGTGVDTIEACFVGFVPTANGLSASAGTIGPCDTATKTWVEPTPTPTPTATPTRTATAAPTPTATPPAAEAPAGLPPTGSEPAAGSRFPWALATALALGGLAVLAGGLFLRKRAR